MAERCPYTIRWGTTEESTTQCDREDHVPAETPLEVMTPDEYNHEGPGLPQFSYQRVTWQAGDRREYTGDWPGYCDKLPGKTFGGGCTLPARHYGRCAP